MKALGIGEGDEVITTSFAFYATVGAIVTAGANQYLLMFVGMNMDPEKLGQQFLQKRKQLYRYIGQENHVKWMLLEIADRHSLFIVEDACHAINATYKNNFMGHYSDASAFSMP